MILLSVIGLLDYWWFLRTQHQFSKSVSTIHVRTASRFLSFTMRLVFFKLKNDVDKLLAIWIKVLPDSVRKWWPSMFISKQSRDLSILVLLPLDRSIFSILRCPNLGHVFLLMIALPQNFQQRCGFLCSLSKSKLSWRDWIDEPNTTRCILFCISPEIPCFRVNMRPAKSFNNLPFQFHLSTTSTAVVSPYRKNSFSSLSRRSSSLHFATTSVGTVQI